MMNTLLQIGAISRIETGSFVTSLVGTIASIAGLIFAILAWKAAIGAKQAANAVAGLVHGIDAIKDTAEILRLCDESVKCFERNASGEAKDSVRGLLLRVNQLKAQPSINGHLESDVWIEITTMLATLDDGLGDMVQGVPGSVVSHAAFRKTMRAVETKITELSAKCVAAAEGIQ